MFSLASRMLCKTIKIHILQNFILSVIRLSLTHKIVAIWLVEKSIIKAILNSRSQYYTLCYDKQQHSISVAKKKKKFINLINKYLSIESYLYIHIINSISITKWLLSINNLFILKKTILTSFFAFLDKHWSYFTRNRAIH